MHNYVTLAQFMRDHETPHDVLIERPGPNEVASIVQGSGDRTLVCMWLIHQTRLRFPISPLLKEVMGQCHLTFMSVSINFGRPVFPVDTLMRREGLLRTQTESWFELAHGLPLSQT